LHLCDAVLCALQVYKKDFVDEALEQAPTTPGMKYRHYSPQAPITLLDIHRHADDNDQEAVCSAAAKQIRGLVCQVAEQYKLTAAQGSNPEGVNGHSNSMPTALIGVLRTTKDLSAKPGLVEGNQACQYGVVDTNERETGGIQVVEYLLGAYTCPEAVARELFRALRLMDDLNVVHIVAEGVVETDEGLAVMNRLRKAATHTVDLKL
jgi:L-threonylcarbamoyladenylate synthase